MRAQIDRQCVINANAQFWEQMLAMKLDPTSFRPSFYVGAGHIVGSVILSGEWNGFIEVRIAGGLVYMAMAAMLMQPANTVGEADALDATKEIANMIAGTIKSSLPRPCSMAVPQSAVEGDGFCALTQTEDSLMVAFSHASGDMLVRVCELECVHGRRADALCMDTGVAPAI